MFPSVPKRRARGAAFAVLATAAAIPAFATSAHATLGPIGGTTYIPKGQVTLETVWAGFVGPADSSGKSFSLNPGQAQFTWYQGKVAAHLTGTMHVDGAKNAQARVRVDSLTVNNAEIGTPTYDNKAGTPINSSSQDVPVDVNVPGAPNLGKVKIVLEEKSNTNKWDDRGEFYAQFVARTDDVTILGKHADIGGIGYSKGAPTDPAAVTWKVGDDGALTATYYGYLHLDGFSGTARTEVRAIDPVLGTVSARADSPQYQSNGAGHDEFPDPAKRVSETIPLISYSPTLEVAIQSWVSVPGEPGGGHWDDIGSQTVSAGDYDN
jgi:hypothetical protein